MNTNMREQEIIDSITSFSRETYHRSEVIPELFALENEVVSLTFSADYAELGNLRIQDVERYFEEMNKSLGGVANKELGKFKSDCKAFCNEISREISGIRGEKKILRYLENLTCAKRILSNVELTTEDARTELDAVVITRRGLFIVEVKNTKQDVFIDEKGNYYRMGNRQHLDSHISYKMEAREKLLRNILAKGGYTELPVTSVVVFTNTSIEVTNFCDTVNTCFPSYLTHMIEDSPKPKAITENQMADIEQLIEAARCMECYPMKLDVKEFKQDFAILMATLECAISEQNTARTEAAPETPEAEESIRLKVRKFFSRIFKGSIVKRAAPAAAAFALAFMSMVIDH